MKNLKLLCCAWAAVLSSLLGPMVAQDKTMADVPARPAELLKSLPSATAPWRMTSSTAEDIPAAWPRSKAMRQFVLELPNPTAGAPPIVAAKLQVAVVDTAGFPDALQRFSAPQVEGSQSVKTTVASMPAFKKGEQGEKERVDALALNRFVLMATLEIPRLDPNSKILPPAKLDTPEQWIEKFNIEPLREASKIAGQIDVTKDHSMVIEKLDEMNPKRSTKSSFTASVEEQVQEKR